jgi:mono/diheme cytochrome c family protein
MKISNTVWSSSFVLAFGLLVGACADEGNGGEDPVSYAAEVQPILVEHCGGCHLKERDGAGKLSFGMNGELAYAALVDQPTSNSSCAQLKRVDSSSTDPMQSSLYVKLVGTTCGKKMPAGMTPIALTDAELATVRQWIVEGAPNN